MKDEECTFCRIIAGEIPAHVIDEDEEVIVFLSLENHPLVVPRAHIPDIYALPRDLGAAVIAETIQVAKAVKQGLKCDGVYLTQANEAAAGQDVFHFHVHVYPIWGDTVRQAIGQFAGAVAGREQVTEGMKVATAEKVRRALRRTRES